MLQDHEQKYVRKVQTSVTNFLYCGDEYLFLKRHENKRVDPGCLNGIGGRLEPGEDYLTAAIRETQEETGYVIGPEHLKLAGVVKLEGGYDEDWVMCFFSIRVSNKHVPIGAKTEDGDLVWIHKDKVLDSEYKLVDDLNYCFKDIVERKRIFFLTAKVDDSKKLYSTSIGRLLD